MARPASPALPAETPRPVEVIGARRDTHDVACPRCAERFNLFAAEWCRCGGHGPTVPDSKRCPSCGDCACSLPDYEEPRLWMSAPAAFQTFGFDRLFVAYL